MKFNMIPYAQKFKNLKNRKFVLGVSTFFQTNFPFQTWLLHSLYVLNVCPVLPFLRYEGSMVIKFAYPEMTRP